MSITIDPSPAADAPRPDRLRPTPDGGRLAQDAPRPSAIDDCPSWCIEHYGEETPVHLGPPRSVPAAEPYSGELRELGYWLERRDQAAEDGGVEVVGVLEVRSLDEVELTPDAMDRLGIALRRLAAVARAEARRAR